MKKNIIILSLSSILSFNNLAFAGNGPSSLSENSLLVTGSLIIAVSAIPIILLEELSQDHTTINHYFVANNPPPKMIVDQVYYADSKVVLNTKITGKNNTNYSIAISDKVYKDADIKLGTEIKVVKNEIGYTLNANNKVIGIVPNNNTNKLLNQEKV